MSFSFQDNGMPQQQQPQHKIQIRSVLNAPQCLHVTHSSVSSSKSSPLHPLFSVIVYDTKHCLKSRSHDASSTIVIASYKKNICTLLTQPLRKLYSGNILCNNSTDHNDHDHHHCSTHKRLQHRYEINCRQSIPFERDIRSVALAYDTFNHNIILFVHTQCGRLWKSSPVEANSTKNDPTFRIFSKLYQMMECVSQKKRENISMVPLLLGVTHTTLYQYKENQPFEIHHPILMAVAGGLEPPCILIFPQTNKRSTSSLSNHDKTQNYHDASFQNHIESIPISGMEDHGSRITFLFFVSKFVLESQLWSTICRLWKSSGEIMIDDKFLEQRNADKTSMHDFQEGALFLASEDGSIFCSLVTMSDNLFVNTDKIIHPTSSPTSTPSLHVTRAHILLNINHDKKTTHGSKESITSIICLSTPSLSNDKHITRKLLVIGSLGSIYILDNLSRYSLFRYLHESLPLIGVYKSVAPLPPSIDISSFCDLWSKKTNDFSDFCPHGKNDTCHPTVVAVLDSGTSFLFPIKDVHNQTPSPSSQSLTRREPPTYVLPIRKEMTFVHICPDHSNSICGDNKKSIYAAFSTYRGAIILIEMMMPFSHLATSNENKALKQQMDIREKLKDLSELEKETHYSNSLFKNKHTFQVKINEIDRALKETRHVTRIVSNILNCISNPLRNSITSKRFFSPFCKTDVVHSKHEKPASRVKIKFQSPISTMMDKMKSQLSYSSWNQCYHVLQSIPPNQPDVHKMQTLCHRKRSTSGRNHPYGQENIKVVFGGTAQSISQNTFFHEKTEMEFQLWDRFPCSAIASVQGIFRNEASEFTWKQCEIVKDGWIENPKVDRLGYVEKSSINTPKDMNKNDPISSSSLLSCRGWVKRIPTSPFLNSSVSEVFQKRDINQYDVLGYVLPLPSLSVRVWDILTELMPFQDVKTSPYKTMNTVEHSDNSHNKWSEELQAEHLVRMHALQENSEFEWNKMPIDIEKKVMQSSSPHPNHQKPYKLNQTTSKLCAGSFTTSLIYQLPHAPKSICKRNLAGLEAIALVTSESSQPNPKRRKIGFAFSSDLDENEMNAVNPLIRSALLERALYYDETLERDTEYALSAYWRSLSGSTIKQKLMNILEEIKGLQSSENENNVQSSIEKSLQLYLRLRELDILLY